MDPDPRRCSARVPYAWIPWALLLTLVGGACSQAEQPRRRPPILIVTIDTLRADHLGCYGYDAHDEPVSPAIDGLARQGVRFEQCFVPRGQTAPSLCSLMLGKYPSRHGVRENGQPFVGAQTTLSAHMARLDYRTAAFISRLPASPEGHPAEGVETFVSGDRQGLATQTESDLFVTRQALAWLDGCSPGDERPFFCWVHLYDVHQPYTPPAPLDRRFTRGYAGDLRQGKRPDWPKISARLAQAAVGETPLAEEDHRYVVGLYDGGVRAADELVGLLLSKLEQRGLADETLVIVTADHGEELGDHGSYYFHGNSIYDGTLRVPWIMRWPGELAAGAVFEPLVQNVDLLPTLLTWLGVEVPDDVEGVSLAPWVGPGAGRAQAGERPRERVYSEWQNLIWTVRDTQHKYVFNPRGAHPKKPPFERYARGFRVRCEELYRIDEDPGERRDVTLEAPQARDRMHALIQGFLGRPGCLTDWNVVEDEQVSANLEALGYIGTDEERSDVILGAEDCATDE